METAVRSLPASIRLVLRSSAQHARPQFSSFCARRRSARVLNSHLFALVGAARVSSILIFLRSSAQRACPQSNFSSSFIIISPKSAKMLV
jgi:hypothetical protein